MVDNVRRTALGTVIARLRVDQGMTNAELADRVDISHRVMRKIELGDLDPDFTTYWTIANVFGMELTEFSRLVVEEATPKC